MSTGFQHNTPPPPYGKKRQGGRRGATHRKPDGFRSRQVFLRQTSRVGSLPSQLSLREGSHGRRLRPRAPSRAVGGTGPGRRPRRVAHTALRGSEHAGNRPQRALERGPLPGTSTEPHTRIGCARRLSGPRCGRRLDAGKSDWTAISLAIFGVPWRGGRTRTASDGTLQRKPLPSLPQRAALHHVDKGQVLREVMSRDLTDTDGAKAHIQAVGELQQLEVFGTATVFRLCAVRAVANAPVEVLENSVDFRLQLRESESPLASRLEQPAVDDRGH